MHKLTKKGFTLIELLVVIAVLGILASVVLVAINPSERIKEARDTGVKSDVDQVMQAVQACYTQQVANNGDYTDCDTLTELQNLSFIKSATALSGVNIAVHDATSAADEAKVYKQLEAESSRPSGCTGNFSWVSYTDGTQAQAVCNSALPGSGYTVGS